MVMMTINNPAQKPYLLFILLLLYALCLTYPLGQHPMSHIPRGAEPAGTVPLFNLWTLQWNIDQLLRGYPDYWDAPIFAPLSGSFAFSEPQPLSAILAMPLWLAFQSPALGYNALVILYLTLNGWFAYWLLRHWRVSVGSSLLAGLMMQSLPFVVQEMGVLQLLALFGFLWSWLFLSRLITSCHQPGFRWGHSFGLGFGITATFLTCGYYGLFNLIFMPVAGLWWFSSRFRQLTSSNWLNLTAQLILAGSLTLLLTGPFVSHQYRLLHQHGFRRTAQTIEHNSARLTDYSHFLDYNFLYGRLLDIEAGSGQRLFPGLGLLLLAGLSLWGTRQRWLKTYLLLATLLAFGLSLGLRLEIGGVIPYQWLRDYLPGLAQLRSPFRFAVLVQLHLVLLAGFGLDNLRFRLTHFRWLVAILAIAEMIALPLPLQAVPSPEIAGWPQWLRHQHDDRNAIQPAGEVEPNQVRIVLLPFAPSSRAADFEPTVRWMLAQNLFQAEMVNGYSGFFPPEHAQLRQAMLEFPSPAGLTQLQDREVDYVVVHHGWPQAPSRQTITAYLPMVYWDEAAKVGIYALPVGLQKSFRPLRE